MPILQSERLSLRPLEMGDVNALQTLAGAWEVAATSLTIPHPYPRTAAVGLVTYARSQLLDGTAFMFAITRRGTDRLIGCVGLTLEPTHQHGELGYWVGVPYWGRGYATEGAASVLEYAFTTLDLHRVFAGCFADNIASRRVLEKIGMRHEGTMRHHYYRWDEWKDRACYGILRTEFEAG